MDVEGRTPLHLAAGRGHELIVDVLLKSEASKNRKTGALETPIDGAVISGQSGAVQPLKVSCDSSQTKSSYSLRVDLDKSDLKIVAPVSTQTTFKNNADDAGITINPESTSPPQAVVKQPDKPAPILNLTKYRPSWFQPSPASSFLWSSSCSMQDDSRITTEELHHDFMSFLTHVQNQNVNFLAITMRPEFGTLGMGCTGVVYQSRQIQGKTFALVCFRFLGGPDTKQIWRLLIAKMAIPYHPILKEHPNIMNIKGICFGTDSLDGGCRLPMLVFCKSPFGDLHSFLKLRQGKKLPFKKRAELCLGIGSALRVLHIYSKGPSRNTRYMLAPNSELDIIHSNIRPNNVLVFKDSQGKFVPKLAGSSSSVIGRSPAEFLCLPQSRPWSAPEWQYRGIRLSDAIKMEIYSFGMLCLFVFFTERFPESSSRSYDIHDFASLARDLVATELDLTNDERRDLDVLFSSTLESDPMNRICDLKKLLELLAPHAQCEATTGSEHNVGVQSAGVPSSLALTTSTAPKTTSISPVKLIAPIEIDLPHKPFEVRFNKYP